MNKWTRRAVIATGMVLISREPENDPALVSTTWSLSAVWILWTESDRRMSTPILERHSPIFP